MLDRSQLIAQAPRNFFLFRRTLARFNPGADNLILASVHMTDNEAEIKQ